MISINQKIISDILNLYSSEINLIISLAKQSVIEFRNSPTKNGGRNNPPVPLPPHSQEEIIYLDTLINEFEDIVKAQPKEINRFKILFDNIITGADISKYHRTFKNELLVRMGYTNLRYDYYARYFEKTGIKSCIYCNSQLAVTVRTIKGKKSVDKLIIKFDDPLKK